MLRDFLVFLRFQVIVLGFADLQQVFASHFSLDLIRYFYFHDKKYR